MYLKDLLSKVKYDGIASEYSFAAGAAKTKALLPDPNYMESIKRVQHRLNPMKGLHRAGFNTYGGNYAYGLNIDTDTTVL